MAERAGENKMHQYNSSTYKSGDTHKKSFKLYKRKLLKGAIKLYFANVSFKIVNLFASLFFANAKKRTRLLVFTDKLLNKKICRCQKLYQECEYYREKIENSKKR